MIWFSFSSSVKDTCKAPRDQLDRCALLLKLCIEAEKATKAPEHGTTFNKMAETFVDRACQYVRDAADPTKEADWQSMKQTLGFSEPILPPNVQSLLREAEQRDGETRRRIANVPKLGKTSDWTTIKLFFVGTATGKRTGEDYEVKRKTPPLALAATVIFSKKRGYYPNFYMTKPDPINHSPADWSANEPTPLELYVVINQGRFDIQLELPLYPPITGNGVFRNVFTLQPQRVYLKDGEGKLHLALDRDLKLERPVQCTRFHRSDQKRIAGPFHCARWKDALNHLLEANDDDWVIKANDGGAQIQPSSFSAPSSPVLSVTSSIFPLSIPSIPSTPLIHPTTPHNILIPKIHTSPIFSPATPYHPHSTHHPASTSSTTLGASSPSLVPTPLISPPNSAISHAGSTATVVSTPNTTGSTSAAAFSSHQAAQIRPTPTTLVNLPRIPIAVGFSPIYKRDNMVKRAVNWTKKRINGE